jgi:hypothetical protein
VEIGNLPRVRSVQRIEGAYWYVSASCPRKETAVVGWSVVVRSTRGLRPGSSRLMCYGGRKHLGCYGACLTTVTRFRSFPLRGRCRCMLHLWSAAARRCCTISEGDSASSSSPGNTSVYINRSMTLNVAGAMPCRVMDDIILQPQPWSQEAQL